MIVTIGWPDYATLESGDEPRQRFVDDDAHTLAPFGMRCPSGATEVTGAG